MFPLLRLCQSVSQFTPCYCSPIVNSNSSNYLFSLLPLLRLRQSSPQISLRLSPFLVILDIADHLLGFLPSLLSMFPLLRLCFGTPSSLHASALQRLPLVNS